MICCKEAFLEILNTAAEKKMNSISSGGREMDWIVIGPCSLDLFSLGNEELVKCIAVDVRGKEGLILILPGCCGDYSENQQRAIRAGMPKEVEIFFTPVENLFGQFPAQEVSVRRCIASLKHLVS